MDSRASSALFERAEQLKRWIESDTNKQSSTMERPPRIQFSTSTVFLASCKAGDKQEIIALLQNGADIDTPNVDGLTALHQACIDDDLDMVEFLVQNGADVNRRDNEGWTPLHATASCGFDSIARFLIENGADVAAVNFDGELPIDIADIPEGMKNILQEAILKQGVDCNKSRKAEFTSLLRDARLWAINGYEDVRDPKTGGTPLHVAAAKGYISVMKTLLEQCKVFPDEVDHEGWTPLHAAALWGQKEAVALLMKNGSDPDIKNYCGQTCTDIVDPSISTWLKGEAMAARRRRALNRTRSSSFRGATSSGAAPRAGGLVNVLRRKVLSKSFTSKVPKLWHKIARDRKPGHQELPPVQRTRFTRSFIQWNREQDKLAAIARRQQTEASLRRTQSLENEKSLSGRRATTTARQKSSSLSTIPPFPKRSTSLGAKRREGEEEEEEEELEELTMIDDSAYDEIIHKAEMQFKQLWGNLERMKAKEKAAAAASTSAGTIVGTSAGTVAATTVATSVATSVATNVATSAATIAATSAGFGASTSAAFGPNTSAGYGPSTSAAISIDKKDSLVTSRRTFVPPVRDDESETQRKAHAKRVRETRRSTQGVTLDELKSAEQLVRKGYDSARSETSTVNKGQDKTTKDKDSRGATSGGDAAVAVACRVAPVSAPPTVSATAAATIAAQHDCRPSWRLRVHPAHKGADGDGSPKPSIPSWSPQAVAEATQAAAEATQAAAEATVVVRRPQLPTDENASSVDDAATKNLEPPANEDEALSPGNVGLGAMTVPSPSTQASINVIQRRRRSKRRSTGVGQVDTDYNTEQGASGDGESQTNMGDTKKDQNVTAEGSRDSGDEKDYKKLYEDLLKERDQLKNEIQLRDERIQRLLESNTAIQETPGGQSATERRATRALERKASELEEELKNMALLQVEAQRLRDENSALIRVISKLSK